ncbi:MAG: Dabb family protein [Proteobacteria bacterium]|nr:MAG: Dabb family protein [Pseudomonadota bacterium]
MIEHIVLFRCNADTTAQIRQGFVLAARTMKDHIPEIIQITAGENWSTRSDGYELALVSRFENKDTLAVYQDHPHHQKFIQDWVKPNVEKVLAVDYFI